MHHRLGSAIQSQLAFPGEGNPNFPWEKSHLDNTVVKKKGKRTTKNNKWGATCYKFVLLNWDFKEIFIFLSVVFLLRDVFLFLYPACLRAKIIQKIIMCWSAYFVKKNCIICVSHNLLWFLCQHAWPWWKFDQPFFVLEKSCLCPNALKTTERENLCLVEKKEKNSPPPLCVC